MCDGYVLTEVLFPDPQEQALGLDCRGWRFVRNLFEKDDG